MCSSVDMPHEGNEIREEPGEEPREIREGFREIRQETRQVHQDVPQGRERARCVGDALRGVLREVQEGGRDVRDAEGDGDGHEKHRQGENARGRGGLFREIR